MQNQAHGKTEKYTRIDPLKNVQKHNRLEKSQEQTVHWKSETSHDRNWQTQLVTIYEQNIGMNMQYVAKTWNAAKNP